VSDLVLTDVAVRYGDRFALHPFSAEVPAGQWLCLIGPNGAGKSSALRAVSNLVHYDGDVGVDGASLRPMRPRERARRVSLVPQSPLIPDDMKVFDYVLLGRSPYVSYFGHESAHDRMLAGDVLQRLDLDGHGARQVGTLSGGERQRLVLARAICQGAPVLLLDEPTSALDIGHQQQALELVDRMRRECGLTVLSAMHDLTLAGLYADRLALLHEGRLVAEGTPAEVLRAEVLSEFYGVSVRVYAHDDGSVAVIPTRGSTLPGY
jgi:iron complex transport system ATP-binding protein